MIQYDDMQTTQETFDSLGTQVSEPVQKQAKTRKPRARKPTDIAI